MNHSNTPPACRIDFGDVSDEIEVAIKGVESHHGATVTGVDISCNPAMFPHHPLARRDVDFPDGVAVMVDLTIQRMQPAQHIRIDAHV